jgi:hypothetical protein
MKKRAKLLVLVLLFCLLLPVSTVRAIEFNNGYIISDMDLFDHQSMTLSEIQTFLEKQNGTLDTFQTLNVDGKMSSAAEIIWQASQDHRINPKFLLVMLQKEQSIVQAPDPTQKQYDWAMGYGVCDACDPDDPGLLIFKGFSTQVDRMAARNRWYADNSVTETWLRQPGNVYKIDGHDVYIVNQATANLYNYTPHIHGNYVFWRIWNGWFTQKYPDGSLLQAEGESGVWLISNGKKRPFFSKSALISRYDIHNILIVSKTELDKYEVGHPIKFSNYSLLETEMGNVYLLVNDELRKFESGDVLRTIGYNPEEFETISLEDFSNYEIGVPITMKSAYPMGALLQNSETGAVFFVQDGKKSPIVTKDILLVNYPMYHLTPVSAEELEKFETIDSVKIKEGSLVMTSESPVVYVVSDGKVRPIVSGDVFVRLGYKWANIKVVSQKSLKNLMLGSSVDLEFKN